MLCVVSSLEPDIIILEIGTGTSYLFANCTVVGSKTDDLVQYLLESYSVLIISVCKVIPHFGASFFNKVAHILNQYLNHYPELCINIISWRHMSFSNPKVRVCLYDGIHLNSHGQYSLCRTAILNALHYLWSSYIRCSDYIIYVCIRNFSPCVCNSFICEHLMAVVWFNPWYCVVHLF